MSYHKYVFDTDKRKFKGNFEEMYQNEEREKFDSWYISNLTILARRVHLEIVNSYNFQTILDFGCGKGAFTHLLKKRNNTVTGLDISKTAIKKAQATYGSEIHFDTIKNNDFSTFLKSCDGRVDLTICLETLSYIKDWKHVIKEISSFSKFFYVALYIPEDPIGFVKSQDDLLGVLANYYDAIEKLIYNDESVFYFGKNKKEI